MKINILFEIKDGPWGGGNQFLKSLKKEFVARGLYEDSLMKSDIVLFNSFQEVSKVINSKRKNADKLFIHRVDGPISLVRGKDKIVDLIIFRTNEILADGTIFQSRWSKKKSEELGLKPNNFETVIYNSPDQSFFYRKGDGLTGTKIKLVASSWSDNPKKGFAYYKFLDETLDFDKYEMFFIGRSPIIFNNIKMTGPLNSSEVARMYREADVYIGATQDEPCSNALIEALTCGIPAVYLNSGGNPELVLGGGEAFEKKEEIEEKIKKIISNYDYYIKKIPVYDMTKTADQYIDFIKNILNKKKSGKYVVKEMTLSRRLKLRILMFIWMLKRLLFKTKSLVWK